MCKPKQQYAQDIPSITFDSHSCVHIGPKQYLFLMSALENLAQNYHKNDPNSYSHRWHLAKSILQYTTWVFQHTSDIKNYAYHNCSYKKHYVTS